MKDRCYCGTMTTLHDFACPLFSGVNAHTFRDGFPNTLRAPTSWVELGSDAVRTRGRTTEHVRR